MGKKHLGLLTGLACLTLSVNAETIDQYEFTALPTEEQNSQQIELVNESASNTAYLSDEALTAKAMTQPANPANTPPGAVAPAPAKTPSPNDAATPGNTPQQHPYHPETEPEKHKQPEKPTPPSGVMQSPSAPKKAEPSPTTAPPTGVTQPPSAPAKASPKPKQPTEQQHTTPPTNPPTGVMQSPAKPAKEAP